MKRVGLVIALLVLAVAVPAIAATPTPQTAHRVRVWATYYGWYDNTPPGCATAYSGCARGTGTYRDPITFASDKAEFPVGTLLYYPTVHKYFRMGDDCQECDLDWSGHGPDGGPRLHHADLWIGGRGGNEFAAINCEDALTRSTRGGRPLLTSFVVDPPDGLRVSSQPLFDTTSGRCFGGATASSTTGTYRNGATGGCLGDPSHRSHAPATASACSGGADQRITFDGAFLIHGLQCLQTSGPRPGAGIVWSRCDGDPREQWEVDPSGAITWVQYTRCVADTRGRIVLSACRRTPAQRWTFHR